MIAGIKSSPVITDLDIKHLSFHALTPHDHPYCLHLPFHIDISHISLTNMYLSSELQHQVDIMPYLNSVPQSKRSHLNLVSPLPQRASIPTSPSCLSQSPGVPLIISHQPLGMLPPHYLSRLFIFVLPHYHYHHCLPTALKQFPNF